MTRTASIILFTLPSILMAAPHDARADACESDLTGDTSGLCDVERTSLSRAPIVVGNDHRFVTGGFTRSARYHRVDVAHLQDSIFGDIYALTGVRNVLSLHGSGEGYYGLYFPDYDYLWGQVYQWGVQTIRVADGCQNGGSYRAIVAAHLTGHPHEMVVVDALDASGNLTELLTIANARFPAVALGRRFDGQQRVLLLYEMTEGDTSSLYYRFVECDGSVGPAWSIRSISGTLPRPYIWHIETAFNPHANRWRVFWDEYIYTSYVPMRTKYVNWSGFHSQSAVIIPNCDPLKSAGDDDGWSSLAVAEDVDLEELPPWETELEDVGVGAGDPSRTPGDGCKRFHVAFDSGYWNFTHQYAMTRYAHTVFLIDHETGMIVDERTRLPPLGWGELSSIPALSTCAVGACSYQVAGSDGSLHSWYLTDRRFTDVFGSCDGGPTRISPFFDWLNSPEALVMASGARTAIVLYVEGRGGDREPLFLSVIDN